MTYKVLDYGAVADGSADDTRAVRAAFEACALNGGGRVVFEGGHIYRSGYVRIYSDTEVYLEAGAVWKASDSFDAFMPEGGHFEYTPLNVPSFAKCDYAGGPGLKFIHALDAENITFSGPGRIDGNESIFYGMKTDDHIDGLFYPRVPMLFLENVRHLTLRQLTLQNSAFWTVHMVGCKDVLVDGIRILNNPCMANCDGIDPDHCENVRIANCHIECADDCVVLKNTAVNAKYGPCRNVLVNNCTFRSTSAAFKIGSESEDLFENIVVSNCVIYDTNRALALQLRDKGSIRNVIFSNINIETHLYSPEGWWGKAEPVYITALPRRDGVKVGGISNVLFENINADCEGDIVIRGTKNENGEDNIRDIRFCNFKLTVREKTKYEKGLVDLRPCEGNIVEKGEFVPGTREVR